MRHPEKEHVSSSVPQYVQSTEEGWLVGDDGSNTLGAKLVDGLLVGAAVGLKLGVDGIGVGMTDGLLVSDASSVTEE